MRDAIEALVLKLAKVSEMGMETSKEGEEMSVAGEAAGAAAAEEGGTDNAPIDMLELMESDDSGE